MKSTHTQVFIPQLRKRRTVYMKNNKKYRRPAVAGRFFVFVRLYNRQNL